MFVAGINLLQRCNSFNLIFKNKKQILRIFISGRTANMLKINITNFMNFALTKLPKRFKIKKLYSVKILFVFSCSLSCFVYSVFETTTVLIKYNSTFLLHCYILYIQLLVPLTTYKELKKWYYN